MSSNSSPMDYQKPVKVKSRWTQSCQIEMMMEESQSSLDMSDTITDISPSDLNEITDYNFEKNCTELRRSRRTSSNKTDYKNVYGLKKTTQKKCKISKPNKKGRKRKQLLHTTAIDKEHKFKDSISHEINNIRHPSIDWNNITICQSKKQTCSVADYNISKVVTTVPPKPTRRASLTWKFKYTPKNDNNLNLTEALSETMSSSIDNCQLLKDDILSHKNKTIKENTSLQMCYSDALSSNNCNGHSNEVLNIEYNRMSVMNSNKQNKSDELNMHFKQGDVEKKYQRNFKIFSDSFPSKLNNFRFSPSGSDFDKSRKIRSRSFDSSITKINDTIIRRSKSYNDINKLDKFVVDIFKVQNSKKKSPLKKRRQSKRIKSKINYVEILDDMKVPEVNYDQVADEIYKEYQNQLLEARLNDKEFNQKLESTNFTLVNENVYRPNRLTLKMCSPSEIATLRKLKQRVISGDINDYCECTLSNEEKKKGITGCNDLCLNRILKVECGSSCSLQRYCTNKQFQNKQFKRTNIIKTEKKGYGICAVEDIPKGVLISEYVGEVIDHNEMCNRLETKEYKNLNYMVRLNSDEIIDSTSKGNVTRFINHSCDPNAVGEKWHVLGQSRIGFFSTRNIKKGEEITFDYSFQIFGDAQVCYCESKKCRGYIGASKPEVKNKLRELSRQLTEIAKLKTGLKVDQELATLSLNRLMVHISDSVSRLHVLTFIREHDMNKRLFMDFSGLSIIHNWMTSNENESFKLMILEILTELPITNRNTITTSKVLDVVAEWAKIPQDSKTKIESLDRAADLQKNSQEIENILPKHNENDNTINLLVEKARALWKKWIVLKKVFKIPKKVDIKPTKEINTNKLSENSVSSSMNISLLNQKKHKTSNKYVNKVQNRQISSLERMKSRKEFELRVEQGRQQIFRKKAMNDWCHEQPEGRIKEKPNQSCLQHQQTLDFLNNINDNDNSILNHNNGIINNTRWDSSQKTNIDQNTIINYDMQIPCLNAMPLHTLQQPLIPFPQYPHTQTQLLPNHHLVNQQTYFDTPSPPLPPNQSYLIRHPQKSTSSLNYKPSYHDIETSDSSATNCLMKSAETNVFKLINESLCKHNFEKTKTINIETEHSKKFCSRTVQCGADLMARIKVVSNGFKQQPSKLIKIKDLKIKNKTKRKLPCPALSDVKLKSVCDKNKKIIFINEQTGVTSNTLNEDLMSTPKTIPVSEKNKFSNAILNSLLKNTILEKDNYVPNKFILKNDDSNIVTCCEINKEIDLYNNIKPKIIKKIVSRIKTAHGFVSVIKRQWGMKLKGLKKNNNKIPATKRNLMRKGSIHKLALKNCLVNTTKSALKRRNNIDVDDCLKRPKEKRVTFWIEGETSPISPRSEIRPINLNQNPVKHKPLMKCLPFEIRNEPKSNLQPSASAVTQNGNLQFPSFIQPFETTNDPTILPIVEKFKASRSRRINLRNKSTNLEQLRNQRTHMIPVSMMSLSMDILKLIPDNRKEMKKVIDYYHSMATVIVHTLGSYAKKTCQQGRIRNDDDFKYLAKKINENVLLKELQLKKIDKLKISDSTKDKVAEYIKKYMSRFGEVYKRKSNEQTNNHKSK